MNYLKNIAAKAEIQEMSFYTWSLALPKRQNSRSSGRNIIGVPSPFITRMHGFSFAAALLSGHELQTQRNGVQLPRQNWQKLQNKFCFFMPRKEIGKATIHFPFYFPFFFSSPPPNPL